MSKSIKTPWGISLYNMQYRKGLYFCHTVSHGGYYLSPRYNKMIPQKFRNQDGWYEENKEALKVEYFLADIVQPTNIKSILQKLECYLEIKIKN